METSCSRSRTRGFSYGWTEIRSFSELKVGLTTETATTPLTFEAALIRSLMAMLEPTPVLLTTLATAERTLVATSAVHRVDPGDRDAAD